MVMRDLLVRTLLDIARREEVWDPAAFPAAQEWSNRVPSEEVEEQDL